MKHTLPILLSVLILLSCSEQTDTVEEYADWKNRNETYFEEQFMRHDPEDIIKKWSLDAGASHTDFILVDRLVSGTETTTPYYTDTATIYYSGRLIPSASYPAGFEFDKSWYGNFDRATAVPETFALGTSSGLIPGFLTALLNMHRGDRWRVTIPYQLGYGSSAQTNIPAYSTLIFEVELEDFWSEKKGDHP